MNLPFFISRRYLVAKKSRNAINVISAIAVGGVSVGAMALIVVLSVFNGFDVVLQQLFNAFEPDLEITPATGKTFVPDSVHLAALSEHPGVLHYAEVVEENALIRYDDKQYIARIKGVSESYADVTGVDTMLVEGEFSLEENGQPRAVVGQGVAYFLSIGLTFTDPLVIYMPERRQQIGIIPQNAFKQNYVFPSGVFSIQQEYDKEYVILPLDFVRDLLDYKNEITALELKLAPDVRAEQVKKDLATMLPENFEIKDRYEQNELFYKIMKSEKWAIYLILSFILAIASFNVIASLTMLIIEKKDDIFTLRSMGASTRTIQKIFFLEGSMISLSGAMTGLVLGIGICWAQIKYGLVSLKGSGAFIIDAYPVKMAWNDVLMVLLIVMVIGLIAAYVPVRYLTKRYLEI